MPSKLETMAKGLKRATGPSETWEYGEMDEGSREKTRHYPGETRTERRGRWAEEFIDRGVADGKWTNDNGAINAADDYEPTPDEDRDMHRAVISRRRWQDRAERSYARGGSR